MQGFTLLEIVVTLGIILLLTGLITSSWPRFRERQAILIAREQLQTVFRQAQQKALNEDRDQDCLDHVQLDPDSRRTCSDIGVALLGTQIVLFADTQGDNKTYSTDDFPLEENKLPNGVHTIGENWQSFLFKGIPPSIELYNQRGELVRTKQDASFVVQIGDADHVFYVSPYGQIEE